MCSTGEDIYPGEKRAVCDSSHGGEEDVGRMDREKRQDGRKKIIPGRIGVSPTVSAHPSTHYSALPVFPRAKDRLQKLCNGCSTPFLEEDEIHNEQTEGSRRSRRKKKEGEDKEDRKDHNY